MIIIIKEYKNNNPGYIIFFKAIFILKLIYIYYILY